jgi:hypothetical protein
VLRVATNQVKNGAALGWIERALNATVWAKKPQPATIHESVSESEGL